MNTNYEGQIFGNREVIRNYCTPEDWISIGKRVPKSTRKSVLCKCLTCGSIAPADITKIKKNPPKRCTVCSNIGNHYGLQTKNNTWAVYDDYAVCNIAYNGEIVSAYVDVDMSDFFRTFTWRISKKKNKFYVATGSKKKGTLSYMHHWIVGAPLGDYEVDHIDGNSLNNRANNLRVVSRRENIDNIFATRIDSQIGIRGVVKDRRSKKYQVDFQYHGDRFYFKTWNRIEEAVWCRKCAEDYYGLNIANRNPLVDQYLTLNEREKADIKQYVTNKLSEMSGNKVYTPVKTYSKERKAEFKMREWEHVNDH